MALITDDTIIKERLKAWAEKSGYSTVSNELTRAGLGDSTIRKLLCGKYRWKLDLSTRYKIGNVLIKQL